VAPPILPIEDCKLSNEDMPADEPTASAQQSPLPPVESLTFESDFRAFLQPHVAEDLKRQALKKLLHDPRFNVMDGLDVYIDDYSVPSPLEPALARALVSARYIFEPPPTRVNAQGHVEEVPAAEAAAPGEGQGGEAPAENHTTPPAFAGTPPRERRGEGDLLGRQGDADANSTAHAARDDSNVPLLTRRGGTRDCADGVVQKRLDQAAAPEITPPDELRDEGEAPR
jgi:hypothetical protein